MDGSHPLSMDPCFCSDPDVYSLVPLSFLSIWQLFLPTGNRRVGNELAQQNEVEVEDFVPARCFHERKT